MPRDTNERKSGVLTDSDRIWLNLTESTSGVDNKYDQKRRCKKGVARAMEDIKDLVEADFDEVSNIDDLVGLFEDTDEVVDLSIEECATALIALAYIITNQNIDYSEIVEELEIHPRNPEDRPESDSRPEAAGSLLDEDIENVLAFRRALSKGIKRGKQRLGESHPNRILIDTNTTLHKPPTRGELDPKNDSGFEFEDAKDAYAHYLDSEAPSEPDEDEEENKESFGREKGIEYMEMMIDLNVGDAIAVRRGLTNQPVESRELNTDSTVITREDLPVPPELTDVRKELLEIASKKSVSRAEFYEALLVQYFNGNNTSKNKEEKIEQLEDQIEK